MSTRTSRPRPRSPRPSDGGAGRGVEGLTLVEVILALALFAAVLGLLLPSVFQGILSDRATVTGDRLRALYRGIMGSPREGRWGFVADVGDLPAALQDLLTRPPGVPAYSTATVEGVGMGWRGPYVDRGFFPGDELRDAWGNPFRYGGRTGFNPQTGRGQVRSAGPDGIFDNADDLVYPLGPVVTTGTLLLVGYVNGFPNPANLTVTIYHAVDGVQQVLPGTPQTTVPSFAGFGFIVHQGPHAVRLAHVGSAGGPPVATTKNLVVTVPAGAQVVAAPRLTSAGVVEPP